MRSDDAIRLRHMLEATEEAIDFAREKSRSDLNFDRMLTLALVKDIEIIGEAATNVSAQTRAECPGIPWQDIAGMRNRLIHAYFDINLDILWKTITDDLPALEIELKKIVSP